MNTYFKIFVIICVLSFIANAQNYVAPKDYAVFKDSQNKPIKVDKDFDGDKINDLAIVYAKNKEIDANVVTVHLSSNKQNIAFLFSSNAYDISFEKNVLTIGSCFGIGSFCQSLVFRFDSNLKTMRLIGYNESDTGNNAHEGAYEKSVNLMTNKYEIVSKELKKKIVKNTEFKTITIGNLNDKTFEYLESIGSQYLKE